jgi:DnaJ family protein C protein 28
MSWETIVEQRIGAAQSEGAFEGLPGRGRPLRLEINPFLNKTMQLSFDMLQQAGFAPRWIELDREIRERLFQAKKILVAALGRDAADNAQVKNALDRYRNSLSEVNTLIRALNLLVPCDRFSRSLIRADREVESVQAEVESMRVEK